MKRRRGKPTREPSTRADPIEVSSLGTTGARTLRQRTPTGQADLTRALAGVGEAVMLTYRHHDDSAVWLTQLLHRRLRSRIGPERVFDLAGHLAPKINAGAIRAAVQRCCVVVLVVGHDEQWTQLRDPTDWMHVEIAYALQLGTPVLSVLLSGVPMATPTQLPPDLAGLAYQQHVRFAGVDSLIRSIESLMDPPPRASQQQARQEAQPPPGEERLVGAGRFTTRQRILGGVEGVGETASTTVEACDEWVATAEGSTSTLVEASPRRIVGAERQTLAKDLVKRYTSGESIRALAASTGRSYGFIHRVLIESGVQLRQRGGARRRKKA